MKSLAAGFRNTVRIGLCVLVVAVAVLALGRDAQPASATEPTRILFSTSNFTPIELNPGIIMFPGGPPLTLYVWAENVVSERGAGSFQLNFDYISWLLHADSMEADADWLSVNQTQVITCASAVITEDLITGQGNALTGCTRLGAPSEPPAPPWGALGTGILGAISISPGTALTAKTTLTMTIGTWLDDTGGVYDEDGDTVLDTEVLPQDIPVKLLSLSIMITPCADFTGATPGVPDGIVTVIDILYEASKFGARSSDPDWNPDWDMDLDEFVTIPDILTVARQFGRGCP